MSTEINLSEYSNTPLYNIKAVVQATGVSSSTLRAWERRYQVCLPQRSDSGYRLYSDRDIATLRWLKTQVDNGMAISQAVSWLDNLKEGNQETSPAILPRFYSEQEIFKALPRLDQPRSLSVLGQELLDALLNYDELKAELIMAEAFALFPIEQIGEQMITPLLIEIGERWHQKSLSVTVEHFATNYVLQRLSALMRIIPNISAGPLIWVGCSPQELHEIGSLLLTIYLRRSGFRVQYLGQTLPDQDFVQDVRKHKPAMILLSASTAASATNLGQLAKQLTKMEMPRPIIGYGGRIFNQQVDLRSNIPGLFLGESAHEAVEVIGDLLYESIYTPQKNKLRAHV